MKKFYSILLAGLMAFSLTGCGSSNEESTATDAPVASGEPTTEVSDMKVAMVTDYGDITDQSFNQTTYEASKAYCEANGCEFTYKKPASDSDQDRSASMEEAIEEGYNVLVLPGFAFAKAIVEVAPLYPDVKFVALDLSEFDLFTANGKQDFKQDNVYSAVYAEELPGYMAGYAAVKLGYTKLGFLGGMAVPAVTKFGYGFVQGADAAAKELGNSADVSVNFVYGGQFFGDADITARMDTWYNAGTEVVFACGGGIFTSAAEAAAKVEGKVIGVDSDQSFVIDGSYGEGMTVTSAMKGLKQTVNTLLTAIQNGEWDNYKGKIETLGIVSENPEENYVGLPETTQFAEGFSQDDYKALVAKMAKGEVVVSNDTETEPTVEITVNYEGSIKG